MNERIRELAEQAGAEIYGHPDYATICVNGQDADALMKKFAQLIIKEAIGIVNKRYMGDNNREDMEVRRCVEDLKKHFGVEK